MNRQRQHVHTNNGPRNVKVSQASFTVAGLWYGEKTLFRQFLIKAGMMLSRNEKQPCVLKVDHITFVKNLKALLKEDADRAEEIYSEFVDGYRKYINDKERFKVALLPTDYGGDEDSTGVTCDSVSRLLLKVDSLQTQVAIILIEELKRFCSDAGNSSASQEELLSKLILNQFRFLENVVDGMTLSASLLNIVTTAPDWMQQEIFSFLPELLSDDHHEPVALQLRDIMQENPSHITGVLKSLNNMTFSKELTLQIKELVFNSMHSAPAETMPVKLEFLLQCSSTAEAVEVVERLRNEFDLCLPRLGNAEDPKLRDSNAVEIFKVIDCAIKYRLHVGDAVSKMLACVRNAPQLVEFKAIDFFLLLILYSTHRRKSALSTLRCAVRARKISDSLISTAMDFKEVVKLYFKYCCEWAELLFRGTDPLLTQFASKLYVEMFRTLEEDFQEEIVTSVVSHCAASSVEDVNTALRVLNEMKKIDLPALRKFPLLLKSVLQFVPQFTVAQVRLLFSVLATVALAEEEESSSLLDDLDICIRKYLCQNDVTHKMMGIAGAMVIFESVSDDRSQTKTIVQDYVNLLQERTSESPGLRRLLFDQLSRVVCSAISVINFSKIQEWAEQLFSTYVVEIDYGSLPDDHELAFNLGDGTVRFVDVSLDAASASGQSSFCSNTDGRPANVLPSLFRFVRLLKSRSDPSLRDLRQTLELPVKYPGKLSLSLFSSLSTDQKKSVCQDLVHAGNWFAELLNAFCAKEGVLDPKRVMARLENFFEVSQALANCLRAVTDESILEELQLSSLVHGLAAKSKGLKRKPKTMLSTSEGKHKARKKRRKNVEQNEENGEASASAEAPETDSLGSVERVVNGSAAKDHSKLDPSAMLPIFRELDWSVFALLKYRAKIEESSEGSLRLSSLHFLLSDLKRKLQRRVSCSLRRPCWFRTVTSTDSAIDDLDKPSSLELFDSVKLITRRLLDHLTLLRAHLLDSLDQSSPPVDDGSSPRSQCLSCVKLVLDCLNLAIKCFPGKVDSIYTVLDSYFDAKSASRTDRGPLIKQFLPLDDLSPSLEFSSALLNLSERLLAFDGSQEYSGQLAKSILERKWEADASSGKPSDFGKQINNALAIYLRSSEEGFHDRVEAILVLSIGKVLETGIFSSEQYKSMKKSNFHFWYDCFLSSLSDRAWEMTDSSQNSMSVQGRLQEWIKSVRIFRFLITAVLAKVHLKQVLSVALQRSPKYLNAFTQNGLSFFDANFRELIDSFRPLLQAVQTSTRSLHNLCTHAKVNKDRSLTRHIPLCRRAIEQFVFRVKATMAANKCSDALQIANLKTKNLYGEVICSQPTADDSHVKPQADGEEDEAHCSNEASDADEAEEDHAVSSRSSEAETDVHPGGAQESESELSVSSGEMSEDY